MTVPPRQPGPRDVVGPTAPGPASGPIPGNAPQVPNSLPGDQREVVHLSQQTRTYPCPNCGDNLVFDPATAKLRSPGCGSTFPVMIEHPGPVSKHALGPTMTALYAELKSAPPQQLEREVVCQNCGGTTLFSGTLTATRCPYCNTPIQRDDIHAAPARLPVDAILPLAIGEDQARTNIEGWINGRWFAPREFKKYRVLGSFTSVYLSYYSYDAEVITDYSGYRGIRRTTRVRDGRISTTIDWYPARGRVHNSIRDLTETANLGLDDRRIRELEPWPTERAVPYTPQFVAGHLARTYDGDAAQVFEKQARPRVNDVIETTVRRDIGGDMQRISDLRPNFQAIDFSYLMLPVWLLTVTYANKPFQVFVNGVTGEVQGERPWSAIKITLAVIAVLIVVAGGAYLYSLG